MASGISNTNVSYGGQLGGARKLGLGSTSYINNLFKGNSIIIVCVIIVALVAVIGYKFSSSFMGGNIFKKSNNKNNNRGYPIVEMVTPQCVYGGLKDETSKILVVNVLSEKMPVFIGIEGPNEEKCISKQNFEAILKQNKNQIPKDVSLVVLMCAGWSCGAAKSYFDDLQLRGIDISRVADYAGGLHEWCTYNKLNKSIFKLFKIRDSNEENIQELDDNEVTALLRNTAHGYKTNTIIENKKEPLTKLCSLGQSISTLL